ncbi:MAG: AAA family ATPase [Treponema sp.]
MILEFSITNTFSISEKQTISFEAVPNKEDDGIFQHCIECEGKKILKLACIYGANASGKTKMLEALNFYMWFMISSFTELEPNKNIIFIPFAFDPELKNAPGEFELILYIKDNDSNKFVRYNYNLKLTKEKVVYEELSYVPKGQKKLIFKRDENNSIKWGSNITGAKKIIEDIIRPNSSVISTGAQVRHLLLKSFYDEVVSSFKGIIEPSSNDYLSEYIFNKIEEEEDVYFKNILINLLSASDIGTIDDIKVILQDFPEILIKRLPIEIQKKITSYKEKLRMVMLSHIYNDKNYPLLFELESNGTKRFMQLALPLYDLIVSKSIVLIDELESSLHGALIELFLKLFLELSDSSQLLFTTHNQDLLDSGLLRDDEVWFCYKKDDGNSIYNSITDYQGIRKGISRKKLYNADKFGALPNINISLLKEVFNAEKDRKSKEQ